MPSPILIAVGGSGQHTVLAYLRLARLCNFTPAHIVTVDADLSQGSQEPSTAELIAHQTSIGFEDKIPYEIATPLPEIHGLQVETFENLVAPSAGKVEEELFRALFTPRQRQVKITNGFHGHPSVAGSTFQMALDDKSFRLSEILNEWFDTREVQHIVVVGSTFGGTGSGVMPVLAGHIRALAKPRNVHLRLGGVIQMRWFDLGVSGEAAGEESSLADVTKHDLDRNSSCLVEYYRQNFENIFDHAYIVGHEPHARRASTGADRQPENPHAVNLLTGYMAYRLLHDPWTNQSKGLVGITTPDSHLETHLRLPYGKTRRETPLRYHIETTGAQVAMGRAILNILAAGSPGMDVVNPYPPFIDTLVGRTRGQYGRPLERVGTTERVEPYSQWQTLLEMQEEALRWLAAVRDASREIEACQFPVNLVPDHRQIGRLEEHEGLLPEPFYKSFRQVLNQLLPEDLGDDKDADYDRMVRRGFYALRRELEGFLEAERHGGVQ